MTLTKDEYLAASGQLATGFGATTDFADPQLGATVQSEGGIPAGHEGLPGQVYTVDQLPNPAAAIAYGLPPQTVPEHLIVETDNHIQGKSTQDIASAELRAKLGDPMLAFDGSVRSQAGSLKAIENIGSDTKSEPEFEDGVATGSGAPAEPAATGSSTPSYSGSTTE